MYRAVKLRPAPDAAEAAGTASVSGGDAQSLVTSAVEHYRGGELQQARELIQSARAADPHYPATHQMEAQIAIDLGDDAGYQVALQQALAENAGTASVQNAGGRLLIAAGSVDEGLEALERSVELEPQNALFARDLAAAYAAQGDLASAVTALERAVESAPADSSAAVALAELYVLVEDWKAAAAQYNRIVRSNPQHSPYRLALARCRYEAEDYSGACSEYAQSIEHDGRKLSLADCIRYGDACLQTGQLDLAQRVFDHASREQGYRSKELELLRGICALHRGDKAAAASIFKAAHSGWADDAELQQLIQRVEYIESE